MAYNLAVRVIAGIARGRRLFAPKGLGTRPTPDRVREALFSVLGGDLSGRRVLDLFAGTGALGIEALSRGAARVVLVDKDKRAIETIHRNLAGVDGGSAEVLPMSAERALATLRSRGVRFDLVFLDPPYSLGLLPWAVDALAQGELLEPDGVIVCEHPSRDPPPTPPPGFVADETRRYGDVCLTLLWRNARGERA